MIGYSGLLFSRQRSPFSRNLKQTGDNSEFFKTKLCILVEAGIAQSL